jgi:hypothetical protein
MAGKDQRLIFEAYQQLNEELSIDDAANALVSGVATIPPEHLKQHVDDIKYDTNPREWSRVLLKIRQFYDSEMQRSGSSSLELLFPHLGPLPTGITPSGRPSYGQL